MEVNLADDTLAFEVNGEKFEVPKVDPSTTLLEFLRTQTRYRAPKLGCGEGGCGACVVVLSKYDPISKEIESFSVSSCLTLLCSVNGCSITTSEGLGNAKNGFHPIHQRFAGFHASQCGYCTPGMCMSFFSALTNAEKTHRTQAPHGFSKLTASEAEKAILGNICRCTGYRPIADACKSFAADADLEDLGLNCFWKKGDKDIGVNKLPSYNQKDHVWPYTEGLDDEFKSTRILNSTKYHWYSPLTIEELQKLLQSEKSENVSKIKLVAGNTGDGYYKETKKYNKYIYLRYIPELSMVKEDNSGIEFGAALSISKVILYLRDKSNDSLSSGGEVFARLADHMGRIASAFVRNAASIGGNLVMAQKKHFPSDLATLLLGVGCNVSILTGRGIQKITFDEFLNRPPLGPTDVLLSVHIPYIETTKIDGYDSKLLFETYRAAPRPLQNALAYLNAAFLADISSNKTGILVNHVRLAFGAYGTKHATRASKVEEYLTGKILSVGVLEEALKLVRSAIVPEDGTLHPEYRKSLAVSFLFSFLITFGGGSGEDFNDALLEEAAKTMTPESIPPLLSSANQIVQSSKEYYPVGEPMPKFGAAIQASGEAVYVDDIPSPSNCLHGAFVIGTKPSVRVKSISFKSNPQVTDVITVKDIPAEGQNIGAVADFGSEPLFGGDVSRFAGDVIAFVVADSQKQAKLAAKKAVIEYNTEGVDPPILTVEEAVKRSSFFDVPSYLWPTEVGDFSKGMAEADHKNVSAEIRLGSQYYFYMETQTALAIPDEDNCMTVYSSIQCPEYEHRAIARVLGVPEHNVRVITRRVGGGFGGKALRSMTVATACALAAHKLRRPVRYYLDRQTDMIVAGGRHPMKIKYTVGFKSNGKITALHLDILMDAGITIDVSPYMPRSFITSLKKYNWGALSFNIKLCKTNRPSKSSMRAPGDMQGSYVAEAIIEHIASLLSMEVDSVKNINLHTYESLKFFYGDNAAGDLIEYTLPSLWDKIAVSSEYDQRTARIKQFNGSNIWYKRGISRVPIVYRVSLSQTPGKVSILNDGSIVVEVGAIEMGQGLFTKVKQMTAYALSSIQCDGTKDLVDKVRIVQTDTISVVQGSFTSGSTTSEASSQAVRLCCDVLVERLAPLAKKLQQQKGLVSWNDLILQAYDENINLAANSYFVPESSSQVYLNYGAAVSEVQINVLTGETTKIRSDIIYDCGQSMNPAVDMGQIEGAFVQGLGFFMHEEYLSNEEGLVVSEGTWDYKVPTLDTIPKEFNVEILNSGHHEKRILSSKACGEPPLLLSVSVLLATKAAIIEARKQLKSWGAAEGTDSIFQLQVPATLPVVKQSCGLNTVEAYLESLRSRAEGESGAKSSYVSLFYKSLNRLSPY